MAITHLTTHSTTALPPLDSIFEDDYISPAQWRDAWHSRAEPDPELKLVWAVLEDAIRCVKAPPQKAVGRHQCEAEMWFRDRSTHPYSFVWCCEMLNLDPSEIRKGVAAMSAQSLGRRRPNVRPWRVVTERER